MNPKFDISNLLFTASVARARSQDLPVLYLWVQFTEEDSL